jgi:hypothetical protein
MAGREAGHFFVYARVRFSGAIDLPTSKYYFFQE